MKTIQLFFVLIFMCASLFSSAQVGNSNNNYTTTKFPTHEIGLRFDDFNGFDFVYKKQKSENKLIRFRFGRVAFGFQDSEPDNQFSFSFGFAIGMEKRISIANRLQFLHGIEPALNYSFQITGDANNMAIQPIIGYVLGFQYDISDQFYINLEAIPSLSASMNITDGTLENQYRLNAGFSSNGLSLSLVYRFDLKK